MKIKDIPKYEKLYAAREDGEIISKERIVHGKGERIQRARILKSKISKHHGYKEVTLCNGFGGKKSFRVHRLIALAFLDNPNNYPAVNHIDGNKLNNAVNNLEWCTTKHNNLHSFRVLKRKASKPNLGKFGRESSNNKAIIQYDKNGVFVAEYETIREAGKKLNISDSHISSVAKGKRKTCAGFIWKYKIKEEVINEQ